VTAITQRGSPPAGASRRSWLPVIGYAGLAALVALWTWRALHDPYPWDTGLAYKAGQVAWATGHPEHVVSWISTPFLGAVMAVLSRFLSVRAVADLVTVCSAVMWVGASVVVLRRARGQLSPVWWWISAFALMSFAPMVSSVGFKQFNVIVLVLAAAGFELVRRGRTSWGAAAIGLSVSIKPMVLLLPFVMLVRRGTRRAGALAVAWVVGLNVAAQAFMAERAHDLGTIDPLIAVRNFIDKTKPNFFSCLPSDFAPVALVCRLSSGGPLHHSTLQRVAATAAVLLICLWVADALRGRSAKSWEVFAFVCPLSVMFSSVEWTHYQIMLAPLFALLLFRFVREGASIGEWAGLVIALVLASLIFAPYHGSPYGSIFAAIKGVVGTAGPPREPTLVEGVAQFAQYVLILTGVVWYFRRRPFEASLRHSYGQLEPRTH
jgi:hypothetical protein